MCSSVVRLIMRWITACAWTDEGIFKITTLGTRFFAFQLAPLHPGDNKRLLEIEQLVTTTSPLKFLQARNITRLAKSMHTSRLARRATKTFSFNAGLPLLLSMFRNIDGSYLPRKEKGESRRRRRPIGERWWRKQKTAGDKWSDRIVGHSEHNHQR